MESDNTPIRVSGNMGLQVWHKPDGSKILVLPNGKRNGLAWYELTPQQVQWLSDTLKESQ